MRIPRIIRNLIFASTVAGFVTFVWLYDSYVKHNSHVRNTKSADGQDKNLLPALLDNQLRLNLSHGSEKHNDLNTGKGSVSAQNKQQSPAVKVDMIRDTAKDIKWSADKNFELGLMKRCSEKTYDLSSLPKASVIICFHGSETLTRLLHTVHSIVQHSPPELLHEIILLADNTKTESHQSPLEQYIKFVFPGKVWIYRSSIQMGLIKCRQQGATLATGQVIISMDAHMELREGWLEPLLFEIHQNRQTMATPYLDWMTEQDDGSWQYEYGCSRYKTVWYWKDMGFTFMEIPVELKHVIDPTEPIISPVTVGTVWAIERKFFFEIGGFDVGMLIWGGENIDLPIRVVLAGGRHINVPCSHAAHCAPRGSRDYRLGHKPEINYRRVIEALFTPEYKETIYYYNPKWKDIEIGDTSERKAIASSLKHNFSYYMEHADVEHLAPNVNTLGWDGIKNVGVLKTSPNACMYIDFSTWLIKLTSCVDFDRHTAGLFLTNEGELHNSNHIIMSNLVDESLTIGNYVGVINTKQVDRWMHKKGGVIQWYPDRKRLRSGTSLLPEKCITVINHDKEPPITLKVSMRQCNRTDPFQQWEFGVYTKAYNNFEKSKSVPVHNDAEDSWMFYKEYTKFLNSYK